MITKNTTQRPDWTPRSDLPDPVPGAQGLVLNLLLCESRYIHRRSQQALLSIPACPLKTWQTCLLSTLAQARMNKNASYFCSMRNWKFTAKKSNFNFISEDIPVSFRTRWQDRHTPFLLKEIDNGPRILK